MAISTDRLNWLIGYLRRESGIALDDSKSYLLRTRLQPLAKERGFSSIDEMIDALKRNERGPLGPLVVDSMTTNETLFFRDQYPFDVLKKVLFPKLAASGNRIKIWSAASSTGQEAYSIAMTAIDSLPQAAQKVQIVGSDISPSVVEYARKGLYKQIEVQRGLPIQMLLRFFKQVEGNNWQVNNDLQTMVRFMQANLINPSLLTTLRPYSTFDIVFCRNVLIYFDLEQRKQVIDQIAQLTNVGGYLFTGAGELVSGHHSKWETERLEGRAVWRLAARQ